MKRKYSTTLNTRPFLYNETKQIAKLINAGLKDDIILEKVVEDNVFQISSEHRKVSFHNIIKKRLATLDDPLFQFFIHSDKQTSKVILFYAILKSDDLFFEWMREVVWDKWLIWDDELQKKETITFMDNKAEQSEQLSKWKDETKNRLVNAYHQALVDAELATKETTSLQLQKPIIDTKVTDYLIQNIEKQYVEVLLGEVVE